MIVASINHHARGNSMTRLLLHNIYLHHIILKSKAETAQLCKSVGSFGALDAVKKYSALLQDFLVFSDKKVLTAGERIVTAIITVLLVKISHS